MVQYDIVPIKNKYRGMGRSLLAADLYTRQTKKEFENLLNIYFEYLDDLEQQLPSKKGLINLIKFCNEVGQYRIMCEVIVYDIYPLETAFDYVLDFLGIDIVHEMSESLLCECADIKVQKFLNKNGLCNSETYVNDIVQLLDNGDVKWEPCYVYKVVY